MKMVKAIIFLMYLISYVYAVHMTSIEPNNDIWGYICGLIFIIFSIAGVTAYSKSMNKEKKEE
jgi:hypothetical protein